MTPSSSMTVMNGIVGTIADGLIPLMLTAFGVACFFRLLMFLTVRRESWFVSEFDKRVHHKLTLISDDEGVSFFTLCRETMLQTYYEIFNLRAKYLRRRPDQVISIYDRLFLIPEGAGRVILEFLKQARYFNRKEQAPRFLELTKAVFQNNPAFSRIFGVINIGFFNNFLNVLPGIFIVCGIFGTFLGIMNGLPSLSGIDVSNPELSKQVMDNFLITVAYAMNTSLMGILLSVVMTFLNIGLSPEDRYYDLINRFTASIEVLWNRCDTNKLNQEDLSFIDFRNELDKSLGFSLSTAKQYEFDKKVLEFCTKIGNQEGGQNVA